MTKSGIYWDRDGNYRTDVSQLRRYGFGMRRTCGRRSTQQRQRIDGFFGEVGLAFVGILVKYI